VFKGVIVILLLLAIVVSLAGTWVVLDKFKGFNLNDDAPKRSVGSSVSGNVGFTILDSEEIEKRENNENLR